MSDSPDSARLLTDAQVDPELLIRAQRRDGFENAYPFASRWMETADGTVHFVDEGSGPVLLMSHGNPTWSFAWRRLIADLSRQYRVIAIDHLGCGFSAKPQQRHAYTLAGHIQRLLNLVRVLDLSGITLFGHDWGGAIGMGCAAEDPPRFRRFVLMNTAAFRSLQMPARIAVCRIPGMGAIGVRGLNLFAGMAVRMAVERRLDDAARRGLLAPYDSWYNRVAVHEFVRDIPLRASHRSYPTLVRVEQGLTQFRDHPMLLVWGMKDWCFTPAFFNEFCQRFPRAEQLPLADAGHYVFEDAHERIIPRVRQFLDSTS